MNNNTTIIPEENYTFDASAQQITLSSPYDGIEIGMIGRIRNLTTSEVLYDIELQDEPISLSGGIITHTHDSSNSSQTDSDILVIYVNMGSAVISSDVGDGRQTVSTPGVAVALGGDVPIKEVTVTAFVGGTGGNGNTDVIVVGGSTVVASESTRRGTPLYAGDSVTMAVDNLNKVFMDSVVASEGCSFTYIE